MTLFMLLLILLKPLLPSPLHLVHHMFLLNHRRQLHYPLHYSKHQPPPPLLKQALPQPISVNLQLLSTYLIRGQELQVFLPAIYPLLSLLYNREMVKLFLVKAFLILRVSTTIPSQCNKIVMMMPLLLRGISKL